MLGFTVRATRNTQRASAISNDKCLMGFFTIMNQDFIFAKSLKNKVMPLRANCKIATEWSYILNSRLIRC
jgi:hypothetical protein